VAVGLVLLAISCAGERPIHPYRLEGFPGAPIEPMHLPLEPGARWVFEERVAEGQRELTMTLVERDGELVITGTRQGEAKVKVVDGFLEVSLAGRAFRPLKLEGHVGDRWTFAGARYTVFGYDRLEVAGAPHRALVVAADRPPVRDRTWSVPHLGWVRIRTERLGAVMRDAFLKEFHPASAN